MTPSQGTEAPLLVRGGTHAGRSEGKDTLGSGFGR